MPVAYKEKSHFDGIAAVLRGCNVDAEVAENSDGYRIKVKLEDGGFALWAPIESSVLWGYSVIDSKGAVADSGKQSIKDGEATPELVAAMIVSEHGFDDAEDDGE
jgi:hypothetical protein